MNQSIANCVQTIHPDVRKHVCVSTLDYGNSEFLESSTRPYVCVLDMDETIIHYRGNKLKLRPHLPQFLRMLAPYYEFIIYTHGTKEYADMILDSVDRLMQLTGYFKKPILTNRLYRDSCKKDAKNKRFKDLAVVKRDLAKTVIIDDQSKNFRYHHMNGLSISRYIG